MSYRIWHIEEVHILETLFGRIIIPEKVAEELQRPKTPQKVKDRMQARPSWLEMRKADISLFTPQKKINDGEREAFALALELQADAILLDDKRSLPEAKRLKLQTIAFFTLLERAAARDLIDLQICRKEGRGRGRKKLSESDFRKFSEWIRGRRVRCGKSKWQVSADGF